MSLPLQWNQRKLNKASLPKTDKTNADSSVLNDLLKGQDAIMNELEEVNESLLVLTNENDSKVTDQVMDIKQELKSYKAALNAMKVEITQVKTHFNQIVKGLKRMLRDQIQQEKQIKSSPPMFKLVSKNNDK